MVVKHENDVNNTSGCFHVGRIYSFMEDTKLYIRSSYIVFLFVTSDNKKFKHVLRVFIAW